jgi:hypothetical protein
MIETRDNTPKVVQDCHALLLWLIPLLDQLPRQRRFTLGERLETELLEVLALLTTAAYQREKRQILDQANARLNVARHLWRLAHELQVIPTRRYEHGVRLIDDIGRQIGGWRRDPQGTGNSGKIAGGSGP